MESKGSRADLISATVLDGCAGECELVSLWECT